MANANKTGMVTVSKQVVSKTTALDSETNPAAATAAQASSSASGAAGEKKKKKATKGVNQKKCKRQRRTFLQLGLVVLSFMIGYIPSASYLMWTTVTNSDNVATDYWFGVSSYLCLRFSECLNPLMYNLGSNKLRKGTGRYLTMVAKKFSRERK